MKVLLINPARDNEVIANNPRIIEEERGLSPPLGLLYVASYLEKYSSHDVVVIDCQAEELDHISLESRIRTVSPDVVGITAMTLTLIDVMETAAVVKRANENIRIVLGGPHVHLFPEETINLENVDFLVMGEGEEAFRDLLDAIDDESRLRNVPNVVFKKGEEIFRGVVRPAMTDLDRLPFPARHLVPCNEYTSLLSQGGVTTTMFTSRGCPFNCSFCDRPHLGKAFRARSARNVVDEIEICVGQGIHDFLFYDDTFTVDKNRVIDICAEIQKRRLEIRWDIRSRIDTVDEEMLKSLHMAGCRGIHYGIEAGSERILTILNKRITIERAKEVFDLTRKYRIGILAYFMIGNPGETLDEIRMTFKVMKMLKPHYVHVTILTPFPGTKVYSDGLARGVIERDYWREFARNPRLGFVPPHWPEFFSREELNELLTEGYREFYLRPTYVVRELFRIRSMSELRKKALAALKVFSMR